MSTESASFDGVRREPVDKLAAFVFAKGVKYTNDVKITCPHWESPPPIRKPPENAPELIGKTFGRFTVVGLHKTMSGSWVVRCSCGDYETRKARSICNPNNFGDRCTKCRNVAFERKRYEYQNTGIDLDVRSL